MNKKSTTTGTKSKPAARSSVLVHIDTATSRPSLLFERCPLIVLFVSTDLQVIWMRGEEAQIYGRDIRQRDHDRTRLYRRLDLVYFIWLRSQMAIAEQHHAAGRISDHHLAVAHDRMALCQTWIEQQFTPKQIATASHAGASTYHPPVMARIAA